MKTNTYGFSNLTTTKKLVPESTTNQYGWTSVTYKVDNQLLTKPMLSDHINSFWHDSIKDDKLYGLYITLEYRGGLFKSLGRVAKVSAVNQSTYLASILAFLAFKNEQYFEQQLVKIHFWFKAIGVDVLIDNESIIHEPRDKYAISTTSTKLFGYDLPNNMNLFTWGTIVFNDSTKVIIEFTKEGEKYIYDIELASDCNIVKIKPLSIAGSVILEFTDISDKGSTVNFTRKVNNF